jgi:hypothetical protein
MRLNPERARLLRDKERGLTRSHPLAVQPGTCKHREIRFNKIRPNQADDAIKLLTRLEHMNVAPGATANSVSIWYEVTDYTLEGLESALIDRGFHLENTLYCKLMRAVVYYCEATQLRNMKVPERLLKKSHEVYSQAWDHHPHGDHDDTPLELREEK